MNQSDMVIATKPVVQAFEALNIPYYIGGSVASSVYGIARATMDVDLVADIKSQHVHALVKQLAADYYIATNMIFDPINRQSSFNLIRLETMLKIDVFVLKNEPYHSITL